MRAWTANGNSATKEPIGRTAEDEEEGAGGAGKGGKGGGRRRSRSPKREWSRGRDVAANGRKGDGGKGKGKSRGRDEWSGAWAGYDWDVAWGGKAGGRKRSANGGKGEGRKPRRAADEDPKMTERAKRFAGAKAETPVAEAETPEEYQRKVDRAKRFGLKAPEPMAAKVAEKPKAEKPKAEKAEPAAPVDPEAAAREEKKKVERAARFGLPVAAAAEKAATPAAPAAPADPEAEAELAKRMAERSKRFAGKMACDKEDAEKEAAATPAPAADAAKEAAAPAAEAAAATPEAAKA